MKTLLAILKKAGGWRPSLYGKIANPPYMPLAGCAAGVEFRACYETLYRESRTVATAWH